MDQFFSFLPELDPTHREEAYWKHYVITKHTKGVDLKERARMLRRTDEYAKMSKEGTRTFLVLTLAVCSKGRQSYDETLATLKSVLSLGDFSLLEKRGMSIVVAGSEGIEDSDEEEGLNKLFDRIDDADLNVLPDKQEMKMFVVFISVAKSHRLDRIVQLCKKRFDLPTGSTFAQAEAHQRANLKSSDLVDELRSSLSFKGRRDNTTPKNGRLNGELRSGAMGLEKVLLVRTLLEYLGSLCGNETGGRPTPVPVLQSNSKADNARLLRDSCGRGRGIVVYILVACKSPAGHSPTYVGSKTVEDALKSYSYYGSRSVLSYLCDLIAENDVTLTRRNTSVWIYQVQNLDSEAQEQREEDLFGTDATSKRRKNPHLYNFFQNHRQAREDAEKRDLYMVLFPLEDEGARKTIIDVCESQLKLGGSQWNEELWSQQQMVDGSLRKVLEKKGGSATGPEKHLGNKGEQGKRIKEGKRKKADVAKSGPPPAKVYKKEESRGCGKGSQETLEDEEENGEEDEPVSARTRPKVS